MLAIAGLAAQGSAAARRQRIGMRKGGKAVKWAARSERLSAALRENLKRRKAQARGRAAVPSAGETAANDAAPDRNDDTAGAGPPTPDFRRNRSNE
jgi:hypothetical protein